ncbi:hypothetical protein EIP91_010999 [Steccherinum ochraceum]|uniref:DUF6699 domain-containing protein n=1 Tax=Steccherinum ochraceum TaxID=92696 RepID=A0A4R0RIZ7_9APHY|nr:hypothetical protein EIP91_010999 [Steccherinum ochraceum]
MGRVPLPEVAEHHIYAAHPEDLIDHKPIIHAPTPRKPAKSLSSLSRGATPTATPAPAPPKPAHTPYHRRVPESPSPDLKKIHSIRTRTTSYPEKPPMSPSEKPPRSPPDERRQRAGERRGSKSSDRSGSSNSTESASKRNVYRPAEGWTSLEMPGNTDPSVPAKDARPSKGILKPGPVRRPSEVQLHWQLLPYHKATSKALLFFDVTQNPNLIRDQTDARAPRQLSALQMEKPAATVSLTTMPIRVDGLGDWEFVASNPGGLSCKDVYDEIYHALNKPLKPREKAGLSAEVIREAREALDMRSRKSTSGISAKIRSDGIARIDLLQQRCIFMGIKRDPENNYWVLQLGKDPSLLSR